MNKFKKDLNVPVFLASTIIIFFVTALGAIFPELSVILFKKLQSWLVVQVSWFYVLSVGSIFFFSVWLMFSRLGDIKLGPDHSVPDYNHFSWFAMLFSAGMGIGLLFFGVAEPIMHYASPPVGDGMTIESAREALKITFFHWGLHAWSIYAVVAVTLAYFSYRKDLPLLPRSAFYPLIGDKIYGNIGHCIDTFAVIGTMFGVATSLGFGVTQVNAGLSYLFQVPQDVSIQVGLIGIITLLATVSVVLGLDGGIKKLSNLNMILAIVLLLSILLLGPTVDLLQSYVQNTGAYLSDIIYKTFNLYAYEKKESWIGGWTLLYWGWWVSWAPFVGMFIARISRGRTIREFLIGVLFVPTGFTFLWMTVFGNSAIKYSMGEGGSGLIEMVNSNVPASLFKFFEYLPFTTMFSLLGLFLIVTFFVSSSDSGSLVIDSLASGGVKDPPVWQRVYWAVLEGVVAAVLLLTGGLEALQTMTIVSAFPMLLLILVGAYSLVKSLKDDYLLLNSVQNHSTVVQYSKASGSWKERLDSLIKYPAFKEVVSFLNEVVYPALSDLAEELKKKGLDVRVDRGSEESVRLVVQNGEVENFSYGVRLRSFTMPSYSNEDTDLYWRAEVFLHQGGQDYDIVGYTKDQIIADAVTQYEKHLHFLHISNSEKL